MIVFTRKQKKAVNKIEAESVQRARGEEIEKILFTGTVQGRVGDLKGRDIQMVYSEETGLIGEFSMIGLPDISQTFIFFDINNLTTMLEDLEKVRLPEKWGRIVIPDNLKKLGRIRYNGNFTGFIDDFVAYGKLESDLGGISTDIAINPDKANHFGFAFFINNRTTYFLLLLFYLILF